MDFSRFSFLYNNYKAYIPIVSFPQCCCSRISLLLHRPDFHHWIWGPDSKDTVGQGFTPGIIELSLNWKELFLSIFKFQLVTFIFIIELKYIDFCSSQPSMVHWLSSSIFPCSFVGCPAMVTPVQISLLVAPHPKTHTFSESL